MPSASFGVHDSTDYIDWRKARRARDSVDSRRT